MKIRRSFGTHIAMLGVWDPERDTHPIGPDQDYERLLERDARHGRVFFIGCGIGEGGSVSLYIDEDPPAALLKDYQRVSRTFRIDCPTGKLRVGGMEAYRSPPDPVETPPDNSFDLPPGIYSLSLHVLRGNAEKLAWDPEHIVEMIGAEDFSYWQRRRPGSGLGCLFLLITASLAFLQWWIPALLVLCAGVGTLAGRHQRRRKDARFKEIDAKVAEFQQQFPDFLFELHSTEEHMAPDGGWHEFETAVFRRA